MKESFNKQYTFLYDVYCMKTYIEDNNEYWTEGVCYEASRDGNTWIIKTNFGGAGYVGKDYLLNDFDEYFIYLS